ncbi:MAG TPA: hypothetical protein VNI83_07895 [Vicinamibacterales bacterium]|nr:hypothetical protein [Vicinamibacterales bacterium]
MPTRSKSSFETPPERTYADALARRSRALQRELRRSSAAAARRFVAFVAGTTDRLNARAHLGGADAAVVRAGVLSQAFVPLLYVREGRPTEAASLLAATWRTLAGRPPVRLQLPPVATTESDAALLELFTLAVTDELLSASRADRGRQIIGRLMTTLRLSFDDLGRVLGVSGETVRRWARGTVAVPEDKLAALDLAGQAVSRLLRLIRLERLPDVIRRPAEAFAGQRALDWILQGRLPEVAERYERELAYQG